MLTGKPLFMLANVSEDDLQLDNDMWTSAAQLRPQENAQVVIVSAQVEAELVELQKKIKLNFSDLLALKKAD
jgi:ribosome-binding ATPase YchF (GTP1/OBG family)